MDFSKNFFAELFKHKGLALVAFGLIALGLGLSGGFRKFDIIWETPYKQIAAVVGLLLVGIGVWLELRPEKKEVETVAVHPLVHMRIDGEYHTEDSHAYRISIIPISRGSLKTSNPNVDYYRIYHVDWEGIGFFDDDCFYSIFQINEKATPPERRNNWGAHRAKWHPKDKSFDVFMIERNGDQLYDEGHGKWIREKDLE